MSNTSTADLLSKELNDILTIEEVTGKFTRKRITADFRNKFRVTTKSFSKKLRGVVRSVSEIKSRMFYLAPGVLKPHPHRSAEYAKYLDDFLAIPTNERTPQQVAFLECHNYMTDKFQFMEIYPPFTGSLLWMPITKDENDIPRRVERFKFHVDNYVEIHRKDDDDD